MTAISYLNFDLLIQPSKAGYSVRVLRSPSGQASSEFIRPFSDLELENFLLRVGRPRRGLRRLESSEREAVRILGGQLFDAVFRDEVETCLRRSMDEAARQDTGLRLRLRLDAPELSEIPWEFLYDADGDRFLALSATTPLIRYLELPERTLPLKVEPPLRVLVMISSPVDGAELDVEAEWAKLKEAVGPLQHRHLLELERLPAATLMALQRQLRRGEYHIFHYVGHGAFDQRSQDGVLLLEDEGGRGRQVSGRDLGAMFYDHRSLRLALLNACEGARTSHTDPFAGVAQCLLRQWIPAIIAMQFEIPDEAAIALASEFYGALADGYPVDAALAEARRAIYAQGGDVEWGTPVLYLHATDGQIFDVLPVGEGLPIEPPVSILYAEALDAMAGEDWVAAAKKLQAILDQQPDHAEAASKLRQVQQEQDLSILYTGGVKHYQAGRWREAIEHLRQVKALRSDYKNADSLLSAAEQEMAQAKHWPWIAIVVAVVLLLAIGTGTYVALRGGQTPIPTDVVALPSTTTPTPSLVPAVEEVTSEPAQATAAWLNQDADGDGLSNRLEMERGTDPDRPDSDGDGLNDGLEISQGLDPLSRDTDGDATPDAQDREPAQAPIPTPTQTAVQAFTPTPSLTALATPTKSPPPLTATPTPTESPPALTATETPIEPPPPPGFVLDSFEDYGSDAALRSAYGINAAWGLNIGQLSLASPPNVATGSRSAAFHYEIRNPGPDDYAGFERTFPTQNWQPYSVLHVWVKSDRGSRNLLIQFREVSGEVWRYRTSLSTFAGGDLQLPLNENTFQHADWSTYQNGRIDLGAIEYYGLYVDDGGQGAGTVYIDDIWLE